MRSDDATQNFKPSEDGSARDMKPCNPQPLPFYVHTHGQHDRQPKGELKAQKRDYDLSTLGHSRNSSDFQSKSYGTRSKLFEVTEQMQGRFLQPVKSVLTCDHTQPLELCHNVLSLRVRCQLR